MIVFALIFIAALELSNLIPIKPEWLDKYPPDEDDR